LAATYGTPLYVVDEASIRDRARRYRAAFAAAWPRTELAFASKANSTLAILKIVHQEGLTIDVASLGELAAAVAAGIPPGDCHYHGNFKKREDLITALTAGIGMVVIDNFEEIQHLATLDRRDTKFAIRLSPGVDPHTHQKISTGQADSKFGFNIADGSAEEALRACRAAGIDPIGFHCHVGSQLLDPEAQRAGGEQLARFAVEMHQRLGYRVSYLNIGGGLGVRYRSDDAPMAVEEYCRLVTAAVIEPLIEGGFDTSDLVLAQEPGRALVAEAGVTLYTVGSVKRTPVRTFVAVDGGLSDNPRPALYQSPYEVELVRGDDRDQWDVSVDGPGAAFGVPLPAKVTISGRHCETDELFRDVDLPGDVRSDDLIQVLTTGAYNASMASNYNRFTRPATALRRQSGATQLIQRREMVEETFARESLPEDLV
jgi:diaminopimelate decarboxylase